ncbi:GAF domain-containing protein [Cellulomonas carbonis]|uniref:GAF domain-containing protein n=1 Tax=Cellulomonas carbonis T26 TaxID=947969 RepID=A0A0A0BM76_9CELL|nr:GAF domain-containing protein [Cellulomonas carbonis]KGM09066.1 hypothetical protein N868_03295 [Cellulomonas carbonis T26]GGC02919.1 hypothetical protein GCM10010972_14920 [Cellulomonas carbonis]
MTDVDLVPAPVLRAGAAAEPPLLGLPTLMRWTGTSAARLTSRLGPTATVSVVVRLSRRRVLHVDPPTGPAADSRLLVGEGPFRESLDRIGALRIPDLRHETRWPAWRDLAAQEGSRAALAMPARGSGNVAVVIAARCRRPRPWTSMELVMVDSVAQEVARAVQTCASLLAAAPAAARADGSAAEALEQALARRAGEAGAGGLEAVRDLARTHG